MSDKISEKDRDLRDLTNSKYLLQQQDKILFHVQNIQQAYSLSTQQLVELIKTPQEQRIPLSIFKTDIPPLEALVLFLKSEGLSFTQIGKILNRSQKTIWATHSNAEKKLIKLQTESDVFVPISIFSDRKLSILEHIALYLEQRNVKLSDIGLLVNKDRRVMWTVLNRAHKKLNISKPLTEKSQFIFAQEKIIYLIQQIITQYNISQKDLLSLLEKPLEEKIPLSIFKNELAPLESLAIFLRSQSKTYAQIGRALGRSEKTIWATEKKALTKNITLDSTGEVLVPLSLFKQRNLSILEHIAHYLTYNGFKLIEIAEILNKDRRVIWTVLNRAHKKLHSSDQMKRGDSRDAKQKNSYSDNATEQSGNTKLSGKRKVNKK